MAETDSEPPHALKEESETEQNHSPATEVTIPNSDDDPDTNRVLSKHEQNRIGFIQKVLFIKLFLVFTLGVSLVNFALPSYSSDTSLILASSIVLFGLLVLIFLTCLGATQTATMSGTDLPPPYYALKEEASTEQNATEVPIPDSDEPHEEPVVYAPNFENKDIRIGFIQKVLAIKFVQALAMTIVMVIFVAEPYPIYRALVYDYSTRVNLIVVSSLILLATLVLIHYCNRSRFVMPYNYIFLAVYPLSFAFFISVVFFERGLVSIFVSWVYFNFILFALLMNSIFAFQTNIEFKTNIGLIISAGILIVLYAFTVPFIYGLNAFGVLYCSLMVFALTAYALNDLQAMMSKTYRIRLTPADFVKAALIMHIDYRYMIMKFYNKNFNAVQRNDGDV